MKRKRPSAFAAAFVFFEKIESSSDYLQSRHASTSGCSLQPAVHAIAARSIVTFAYPKGQKPPSFRPRMKGGARRTAGS